ncbi:MAG TPA: GNAT family protein [Acidobacteriota bacterium]|nr:GNAT family protein [Acidobacteriota bacterium]
MSNTETIRCVPTSEADLDVVLTMERDEENAQTIRQWPREKHRAAIADPSIAHLLVRATTDNRVVGFVVIIGLDDPDGNIEFKRIVIAEKDRGFGRAAVRQIANLTFTELGAHRLWLEVMRDNAPAIRLYQSEGFTYEGIHRQSMKRGDTYADLVVMSMLASEFTATEQSPPQ